MPNVLVVDDSAVDAKLFSRIIEKIPGVNVVVAEHGRDAIPFFGRTKMNLLNFLLVLTFASSLVGCEHALAFQDKVGKDATAKQIWDQQRHGFGKGIFKISRI